MHLSLSAVLAGVLYAPQLGLSWTRHGNGATLRGYELAAQLRHGEWAPAWGPSAAVGIYVVALIGCALVATAAVGHRVLSWVRLGVALGLAAVLVALVASRALPIGNWDLGPMATASGALILGCGSAFELRRGRPVHEM